MPVAKLLEYLDREKIHYIIITHSPAVTAQKIAASAHVPGNELAKTVMISVYGKLAMVVLPASQRIDLSLLRAGLNDSPVHLAAEAEFAYQFPDCEVGAMPPFGNLYGMDVFVEQSLTRDRHIAFNAGTLRELIRMEYSDFERLVRPRVMQFALHGSATAA